MEKSPFFTNNSAPIYWNTGGSQQEGAFSQKLHPYHHQRPSTSDQYTQHNTLAGTFRGYPGVTTATYNFDQQQQAQQQFQNREDDCIWYYQDPNGRIQGGFSSEQMASWFAAGRYFTPQLLIRRKCDDTLSTLQSYIDIYGEVPFGSKVKVPPVRGGITPDLITYYRTIQTPTSFSTDLIAQMEKDPAYQKLLADTGIPVRVLMKSLEMPALSVIKRVRGNADSSWPSPQQCQLLSQLQEVVQRQQSTNDNSQSSCTSKGTTATLNGDVTVAPSSDSDRTIRNSSSTGSEPKPKSSRQPQQQPIGSKVNVATTEGGVKSNQQQQGRSRATTTGGQAEQTPSHVAIPKTPAVKNCWAERGAAAIIKAAATGNGCAQSTPSKPQPAAILTPQKPILAPIQCGTLEAANAKKRNKQSKQSSPVQSIGNTKKPENGKKTTKGGSAMPRTPEMESLIQWTEQALKGVTMSVQHVDIPTLVECLVMIDGPFEVENVILDHVESTPRTQQFVRDFLDRRHTCWQQYKKQKEEEENQKKSQKSADNVETSGYIGATKTYQEANDSSPENAWRQIKSKGGSGRRGKKGAKNR
ncbi:unnamed protein product [Hymenolepis diminuta]|nr:unnamed protein product [Hymenolepis diminuta]